MKRREGERRYVEYVAEGNEFVWDNRNLKL
jgi:hypothetical protein